MRKRVFYSVIVSLIMLGVGYVAVLMGINHGGLSMSCMRGVREILSPRVFAQWEMARGQLADLSFYGKVIDQHGRPISGAKVKVGVIGGGTYAPGKGKGDYPTDEEGIFHVKGKGSSITIYRIKHPQVTTYINKNGTTDTHLYPFEKRGSVGIWTQHTKRDNPFVLEVWREEIFRDVKASERQTFTPAPDSQFYTYFLSPGSAELVENEVSGIDPSGILAISCYRGTDIHDPAQTAKHLRTGSWRIVIKAINGGIQFADKSDVYINLAPEEGYKQEVVFESQARKESYERRIFSPGNLYIKAENGLVYGALRLKTVDAYGKEDSCWISSEIKYTTDGTRNLAVKQKPGW